MTKQQSLVAIWETRLQMIRSHFFLSYPWRRTLPLSAPVTRITAARGQSLARNTALGLHVCTVHQWQTLYYPTDAQYTIQYVDTIKIIKYLKVFQHVSDDRGYIIREPCTVLGSKLQEWFYRVRWHGQGRCYGSIFWPVARVCSLLYMKALQCVVHCIWRHSSV